MSDMKCPICNEGKIIANLDGTYECDNPECPIWNGTETATIETLIRTRKALDVALDKLKRIQKIYTNAQFNVPINYANVCTDMYDVATEQITALEQKDK